jgi:DnaJ homolog subfamily C member 9
MGKLPNKSKSTPKIDRIGKLRKKCKSEDENILSDEENKTENEKSNGSKNESGLLNECQKLFGLKDLYEILNLKKTATVNEIKKAYHKLSLKVHPDKVDESLKEESTLKFQAIGKIYTILSNDEKRRIYDETSVIDGENDFAMNDDMDWRVLFKKVTVEDIDDFFKAYKDSNDEKEDLKRAYIKHKGDLNLIMEEMLSSSAVEDEERFREILKKAIDNEEIEEFRNFTHETKNRKDKRKLKYEKEAKEAEDLKKELGIEGENDIRKVIAQRQESRKQVADNFLDSLAEKYGKKDNQPAKKGRTSKK